MRTDVAAQLRRQIAAHRASELLYGAVVSASVLAVASVDSEHADRVVLATAGVAIVYWLTHVYVDAIGGRFLDPDHTTAWRLRHAVATNWAVLVGAAPPVLVYSLGRTLGLGVSAAGWVAMWSAVALLMGAGGVAAWRAGARRWSLASEVLVCGSLGIVVIGLKYLLH